MSSGEDVLARRAAEQVQNDSHLIETVAVEVARALNLEGNNRTLGRKFVRLALVSDSIENFKERTIEYGQVRKEILVEIFHRIKQKYANLLLHYREESEGEVDDQSLFGFSGKTETLNSTQPSHIKGGLQNRDTSSHQFQKPEGSGRSTLGLDKHEKSKQKSRSKISVSWDGEEEFVREEDAKDLSRNVPQKRTIRSSDGSGESRDQRPVGNAPKRSREDREKAKKNFQGPPTRSGIGLNEDEWEEPEQLSSSLERKVTADRYEYESGGRSTSSTNPRVSRPANSRKYGSLYDDAEEERERNLRQTLGKESRLDVNGDDEFERDFYLSEEGQIFDTDAGANERFLGSNEKFSAREEQMAKSRARGDQKIAGMSARKSQLHADQEAWEDNRLLQSGVASEREVIHNHYSNHLISLVAVGPN
jgi:hypothetical protein